MVVFRNLFAFSFFEETRREGHALCGYGRRAQFAISLFCAAGAGGTDVEAVGDLFGWRADYINCRVWYSQNQICV